MDSRVTLALMAKARLVFEQPDTALSFPVPPFALSAGHLRAAGGELADPKDKGAAYEFARLVNQCPTLPIWTPAADVMLWTLCDDILNRSGQVAQVERSAEDEAAFHAAEQVLFTVDAQGLRTLSPRAKLYAQYRDSWFTLQGACRARRIAAESPTATDAVKAAWTQDEPALRREIETLEKDWRSQGFRSEVESAQATLDMLGSRGPSLQWDRWTQNFRSFLDSRTDAASEARFCPTTYTPANVVDSAGWIDFVISGAEFQHLIGEAPPPLRARLDPSGTGPAVSRVSFASTTVGVTRPWIDMGIFRADFWRFADGNRVLSDGGSPPRGEWPAYVAGLVLARHVVVDSAPQPHTPAGTGPTRVGGAVVRDHRTGGARGLPVRGGPAVQVRRRGRRPVPFERRILVPPRRQIVAPAPQALAMLHATQVTRLDRPVAAVAGLTQSPAKPTPARDEVYILAFICRTLPKCPNPDPKLFRR